MKKILISAFLLLCYSFISAQNLVPNGSFEEYDTCPDFFDQIHYAVGWSGFSADYYNSCNTDIYSYSTPYNIFGFQYPATGSAYAGIYCYVASGQNYREFIQSQLTTPLIKGNKYFVTIKVSCSNNGGAAINNIGIDFSSFPRDYSFSMPITNEAKVYSHTIVSDTSNWTIISGAFVSDSAYQYILIGNFFSDDSSDKVIINPGASAYYFIDDICVSSDSLDCEFAIDGIVNSLNNEVTAYPNPANRKITINAKDDIAFEFSIIDFLGKKIRTNKIIRTNIIEVSDLPNGIYFLEIKYKNQIFFKKQLIIH